MSKVDPSGMYGTGADAGSSYADWWNKMFGGGKTGGGGSTGSTPTQSTDEGDAARLDIASGGATLEGKRAEPVTGGAGGTGTDINLDFAPDYPRKPPNPMFPNAGTYTTTYPGHAGHPKGLYAVDLWPVDNQTAGDGTAIIAPGRGRVVNTVLKYPNDYRTEAHVGEASFGNQIMIEYTLYDGSKIYVVYAHLQQDSPLAERTEDEVWVDAGDVIGYVGSTGGGTGGHLHLEIRSQPEYVFEGKRTHLEDPMKYYAQIVK